MSSVYSIKKPKNPLPLIFDSPHSGRRYPEDFRYSCALEELERTEDRYVDALFAAAPDYGGALLCALFARSYLDLNRAEDDIDPQLFDGLWPAEMGPINPTARSDSGIGLIRRLLKPGARIYDRALSPAEIRARIDTCYRPYMAALEALYKEAQYNFGQVYHINCHAMPHESARPRRPHDLMGQGPRYSDFVLGDRDGTTAGKDFMHSLRDFLAGKGFAVTINDPFKGVELIGRYSQPTRGLHAVQLEIDKSLYMNEETGEKTRHYGALQDTITALIVHIADYVSTQLKDLAAD